MAQGNDVLKRINERYPHLSKGQKLLANYITEHYEKAVYLTASKLGQIVGVSESTVVRFANELGYDGYPSLQRALEELVKVRLTALQRMEVSKGRMDQSH
ncbi:MAG: MurR/RpiR family transcriptional regulator, partial [Clostridia bacterium]